MKDTERLIEIVEYFIETIDHISEYGMIDDKDHYLNLVDEFYNLISEEE